VVLERAARARHAHGKLDRDRAHHEMERKNFLRMLADRQRTQAATPSGRKPEEQGGALMGTILSDSGSPTRAGDAGSERSAPASQRQAIQGSSSPDPAKGMVQCASCGAPMKIHRRTRLYCSGRCRAAASIQRRITAAVDEERHRAKAAGASRETGSAGQTAKPVIDPSWDLEL
jgi:hypothetical protein